MKTYAPGVPIATRLGAEGSIMIADRGDLELMSQRQFSDSLTTRQPGAALQCAPAVLMVRPAHFGYNPQTADSNRFQRETQDVVSIPEQALA
jgi:hypothetical protein